MNRKAKVEKLLKDALIVLSDGDLSLDRKAIEESFGTGGGITYSFISVPFTNTGASFDSRHPLDLEVFIDCDQNERVAVGQTNLGKEVLEAFGECPEDYTDKMLAMSAALRELADNIDKLRQSGV